MSVSPFIWLQRCNHVPAHKPFPYPNYIGVFFWLQWFCVGGTLTVFEGLCLKDLGKPPFMEGNKSPLEGIPVNIVQQKGYIVLPLLGAIEIEGLSTEEVVRALQAAFKRSMRRVAKASVMLIDREPVYVVGKGIKPGAFKFSPGMTVLHAVALTGTVKDQNSDLYAHTEYARGLERLKIATQRLKKQLGQAAALRAQQSGQSPEIPARPREHVW